MRLTHAVVVFAALSAGPLGARAGERIFGLPDECDMSVYRVDREGDALRLSASFMEGGWTWSAATASHDGRALLVHVVDGFQVLPVAGGRWPFRRDPGRLLPPRSVAWRHDDARVAFVGERGQVVVVDVTTRPPRVALTYTPVDGLLPAELTWTGDALVVLERPHRTDGPAALRRVEPNGRVHDLLVGRRTRALIAPDALRADDHLALATLHDTLAVVDLATGETRPLPLAGGLTGADWSPDRRRLLLSYRWPLLPQGGGAQVAGLALVDLADPGSPRLLDEDSGVLTEWFSPDGRRAVWATAWCLKVADLDAPDLRATVIAEGADGALLTGVRFDPGGARFAFTRGNEVFVHDLATGETRPWARFGTLDQGFVAEPRWAGDQVLVSHFADAERVRRDMFRRMSESHPHDPTLGRPRGGR